MTDPHHCRCFSIRVPHIESFRTILSDFGFKDELQENHGQVFGYVLRVEDKLQLHVKVMPDGSIESEMEPPPAYPAAHLNQEHSYSAHQETEQVLRLSRIGYGIIPEIPHTCIHRKIKKPYKPTHASGFALAGLAGVVIAAILLKLLADDDDRA